MAKKNTYTNKNGTATNKNINSKGDTIVQVKTKKGTYTTKTIPKQTTFAEDVKSKRINPIPEYQYKKEIKALPGHSMKAGSTSKQSIPGKIADVIFNPFTAAGYAVRGQEIPDFMSTKIKNGTLGYYDNAGRWQSGRNPFDITADLGPIGWAHSASDIMEKAINKPEELTSEDNLWDVANITTAGLTRIKPRFNLSKNTYVPANRYNFNMGLSNPSTINTETVAKEILSNTSGHGNFKEGGEIPPTKKRNIEGDLISKVIMERNRDKDFVQRAYALGENPGTPMFNVFEPNEFGQTMSHKMAWEEDEKGQTWMFPTVLNPKNEAIQVPNQYADYISSEGYKNATGMTQEKNGGMIYNEQDLIQRYPHQYEIYKQQMALGGEIPQYGFGEWLGKNAGIIGTVVGGAAGFFVGGPAGVMAGAKLGGMAGGALQKGYEHKQEMKKQQELIDAEKAKTNSAQSQVPATPEVPVEEPKRIEAMNNMFALGGKLGMHSPMCECMACGGRIKQHEMGAYLSQYGDGKRLSAGAGTKGVEVNYQGAPNEDDYRSHIKFNAPLTPEQRYALTVGGSTGLGSGSGIRSLGELSYTEGQGVDARIDGGYNFQLGNNKLRAGKGQLNIMPYAGAKPSLSQFGEEMLELNEEGDSRTGSITDGGEDRGVFHTGLKADLQYKPSKHPLYLFANGQIEAATKGPYQEFEMKGDKKINGEIRHGSIMDPRIDVNGQVGVRYNIGEKTERGKRGNRFAGGGEIGMNPKFEAEGGEVIQAAGMQVQGANNPNLKYYEDGSAMIQGNDHNGTSSNPESGVKMNTSSATNGRIFSKRLKNPETKKPFSAEAERILSKMDKYAKVAKQTDSEPIARKTATLMTAKYQRELDALFQKQESLKQTPNMGQSAAPSIQGITPEMQQQMMMMQQGQAQMEAQEPQMHEQQEQQLPPEAYAQAEQQEAMMQQAYGGFVSNNRQIIQHANGTDNTNAGVTIIPVGINDVQARNRYQNQLLALYAENEKTKEAIDQTFEMGTPKPRQDYADIPNLPARQARPVSYNYNPGTIQAPAARTNANASGLSPSFLKALANTKFFNGGYIDEPQMGMGGDLMKTAGPLVISALTGIPPGLVSAVASKFQDKEEIPQHGAGELVQGAGHFMGALSSLPTSIHDWKQSKKDPYKWNALENKQAGNVNANLGLMSDTAKNMDFQARKDFQTSRGIYDQMGPLNVAQQRADAKNVLGSQMAALRGGAGSRAEMLAGATSYGDQMNNQLGKVEAYKNQFDMEQQQRRATGYSQLGAQDAQLQASKSQLFGNLGAMYQNIGQADREYDQSIAEYNKQEKDLRAAQRRSAVRGFGQGISDLGKTAVSIGQGLTT